MKKKNNRKVAVIGLDGATFGIIEPLVKQGKLPNLARLIKEQAYGDLESTFPPVTPCAWTSAVTGKRPSKHGLFDFNLHEGDPEKKKSINRTLVKTKAIWKLLTESGKKSIAIDIPLTYPPEEIDGTIIARVMAPPKKNCTYPKSLYYTLKKKGYIKKSRKKEADVHGANNANKEEVMPDKPPVRKKMTKTQIKKAGKDRIEKAFKNMIEDIEKNVELAKWMASTRKWDFFMIVFMSADHAGHTFWKDQPKVKKIYEKLDWAVGELFAFFGEDINKFIMSDHGFTSIPYFFNVNEWLYEKGLLYKSLDIPSKESIKELKNFLKDLKHKPLAKKDNKLQKFRYLLKTDYKKSKAYLQSGTSYGVRINLEERDTTGIVKKDEYNKFRDYLIRELKKLKHPLTKKKIFSRIVKKEDAYLDDSEAVNPAPDIFLITNDMEIMVQGQFTQNPKTYGETAKGYGFHHTHGIFFAAGKDIEKKKVNDANIIDLMPTILHTMDIPIPIDTDGRVLREIFKKDSFNAKKEKTHQGSSAVEVKEKAYSKAEEEKIKQRLEALGYIE